MCPRPLVNARQRNPVRRLAMLSPFNSILQASLSFAFLEQGGRVRGYKMGRPSRRVQPAAAAVSFPEDGGVVEAATDNQSGDVGTVSLSCRGFTHPKYACSVEAGTDLLSKPPAGRRGASRRVLH